MKGSSFLAPIGKRLEGKVALITGAASGIGESAARLFVKHGAEVVLADIQDELGHSVCTDIGSRQVVSYVHCDVSKETDVENAVNTTVESYGKLDILFSNAGIESRSGTRIAGVEYEQGRMQLTKWGTFVPPFFFILYSNIELDIRKKKIAPTFFSLLDLHRPHSKYSRSAPEYKEYKRVFDINVFGSIAAAKHAARVMVPAKSGSIVFTSSVASVTCGHFSYPYLASKHAMVGFAKNLGVELGQHSIRVNCVSPFGLATPLLLRGLGGVGKDKVEEMLHEAANLKGTVLDSQDVANAALYFASDESKYVSGTNLVVDGGYSTTNVSLGIAMRNFLSKI